MKKLATILVFSIAYSANMVAMEKNKEEWIIIEKKKIKRNPSLKEFAQANFEENCLKKKFV